MGIMSNSSGNDDPINFDNSTLSREKELSEIERTKAGLKGLVDSGITQVPNIFIYPKELIQIESTEICIKSRLQVPVIDLQGYQSEHRSNIVSELLTVSKTWGMFQLINHGLPQEVIQQLLKCIQEFNEQPNELKSEFYTRDETAQVQYRLSLHQVFQTALWKDTMTCYFENLSSEELEAIPTVCRNTMSEYLKCVDKLKDILSELLSEALGLKSDYLKKTECLESHILNCHYYPACPEPSLAMGSSKHSDPYFLTILVQNHIDALQILHDNHWIDVNLKEGAIIVNIGDMLQILSNDIFQSAVHRVVAKSSGPRLSVACFLHPGSKNKDRSLGPIKEVLEGNNILPVYRNTSSAEYLECFRKRGTGGFKALPEFRL